MAQQQRQAQARAAQAQKQARPKSPATVEKKLNVDVQRVSQERKKRPPAAASPAPATPRSNAKKMTEPKNSKDNYEKSTCLGRGAFGACWVAKFKPTGEIFAIKEVPLKGLGSDEIKSCLKEVGFLARLQHDYIIDYHGRFEDEEGRLNIVMEFAAGGDLAGIIKRYQDPLKYLQENQVLMYTFQIATALKYLHDMRILHRDLKPQNVFLDSKGQVKLGDFGIARALESTRGVAQTAVGTPQYMAPELYTGEDYGVTADQWSLGCVVFELMALKPPFSGNNILAVTNNVVNNDPEDIPEVFSEELRSLTLLLLDKTPTNRPTCERLLNTTLLRSIMNAKQKKEYGNTTTFHLNASSTPKGDAGGVGGLGLQHTNSFHVLDTGSPKWHKDTDYQQCESCKKGFSLIHRRHHCRVCGRVLCGDCTRNRINVGGTNVRVCVTCMAEHGGLKASH